MIRPGGLRRRLIVLVIVLVGVTATLVGSISVYLVDRSLRGRLVEEAAATVEFNLGVLAPAAGLPAEPDRDTVATSGIINRFLSRGIDGVWVEFPDGEFLADGLGPLAVSDQLRSLVAQGEIGYEFVDTAQGPALISAGRLPSGGPDFYFVTAASIVGDTVRRLVFTVSGVGLGVLVAGAAVAAAVARRILRPVAAAQMGAERLAEGDLSVRIPQEGSDEFARLSSSFNMMASSLQETIEALSAARLRERQFVADASHELRTPLTGLVNEAAMLRQRLSSRENITEDDRTIAAMLDGDAGRLRHLVEELLEISRLDSEAQAAVPSVVDIDAFIRALISERHSTARLTTDVTERVYVDAHGLERIVGNLLDNARIHAISAPTSVDVSLENGTLQIVVADQGPGVEETNMTRIFDRFMTANPARTSGSGLGLSIVDQHVRRLGGEVSATPTPGGGLTVTVSLPVGKLLHSGEDHETPGRQDGQ